MRFRTVAGLAFAGTTLLAACGGGGRGSTQAAASPAEGSPSATTAVKVSTSQLGDVLVDGDGRTLYGFTNDANGTSTCTGTCAQSWPPLKVSADWKAGSGVDSAIFHTIRRDDGQLQLGAGKWPLYRFAGDSRRGDVNGQGSLGKWFVVHPDGTLLKNSSSGSTPSSSAPAMSGNGY